MTNDAPRRGRRRRRNRTGIDPTAIKAPTAHEDDLEWRWRTFPVGFAFVLGALAMGVLTLIAPGGFYVFLVTAFFFVIFGIAHYFGRSLRDYRSRDDEV